MSASQTPLASDSWPVHGHEWAVRLLQRVAPPGQHDPAVKASYDPRHAYLLLGPRQVGKTTLAKSFAAALLCTGQQTPCGLCRSCQLLAHDNHPDFHLVQPLDREGSVDRANGLLRAEQAAELIHAATLRPLEGRYRLFLLQDAHLANDTFANKLLKTLEEPPAHVILVLTALERTTLLPTIVSRCQILELRPVDADTVAFALRQDWHVESGRAELLARLSNGRLGWAVQQIEHEGAWQQRLEQLQTLWALMAGNRIERLRFAEKLATDRDNSHLFSLLEAWTTWWRDIVLAQSGCLDACGNIDLHDEIAQQAALVAPEQARHFIHTLRRIEGYLHHTVNTRLALDVLVLSLPRLDIAGA